MRDACEKCMCTRIMWDADGIYTCSEGQLTRSKRARFREESEENESEEPLCSLGMCEREREKEKRVQVGIFVEKN